VLQLVQKRFTFDGNGSYVTYDKMAYDRYVRYDREHDSFGKGKLRTRPLRFNCIKIFLNASFIQGQWVGLVTKKEGFPKLYPTLANSRDHARFGTNTEACQHFEASMQNVGTY